MASIFAVIFILVQQPAYEGLGMECILLIFLHKDSMLSDTLYEFPRITLFYLFIYLFIFIFFVIDIVGTSAKLTPLQLETLLTEGNTSRFWLVGSIGLFSNF